MMDKIDFFYDLEEIITDNIYIGLNIEDLNEEIRQNTWSISMSEEIAKQIESKDFINFFEKVIANEFLPPLIVF